MPIESRITDPPAVFLQKVGGMTDVKGLENVHRILHAWMAELASASPKTLIGNGWTPRTVQAAHEVVVSRIKALKPDFKHTSPIAAAKPTLGMPVMLVPNYISLVGSTLNNKPGADKDIVVRDTGPKNESLEIRIAQLMGGEAHVSYNPSGPHDLRSKPLYHLALVPVELWKSIEGETTPVEAAFKTYRGLLEHVLPLPAYQKRVILGAGLLRSRIRKGMPLENAEREGEAAAQWVFGNEHLERFHPKVHDVLQGAWDVDKLYKTAMKVYKGLIGPIVDYLAYGEGLKEIYRQIEEWKEEKKDPFKDEDEALDAARELGASAAKKHGKAREE